MSDIEQGIKNVLESLAETFEAEKQSMTEIERAIEFLQSLGKEMKEQDNDYQAAPRFWVVAENKRDYGIDENYCDGTVICDSEGHEWNTTKDFIQSLIENGEIEESQLISNYEYDFEELSKTLHLHDYRICGYRNIYDAIVPNTFFLTKRECKEHIANNHYHYTEPHTYAMTAWRSPQVERLYGIIENIEWGTVLAALRSELDRVGCEYCNDGEAMACGQDSLRRAGYIYLDGNLLTADLYSDSMAVAVCYCPMCGKNLREDMSCG